MVFFVEQVVPVQFFQFFFDFRHRVDQEEQLVLAEGVETRRRRLAHFGEESLEHSDTLLGDRLLLAVFVGQAGVQDHDLPVERHFHQLEEVG